MSENIKMLEGNILSVLVDDVHDVEKVLVHDEHKFLNMFFKDDSYKWIPFKERPPEEHEWIGTKPFGTTISDTVHITFDVNGERFVKCMRLQNGTLSNADKNTMDAIYKDWKMVAWMPLPEPYKES